MNEREMEAVLMGIFGNDADVLVDVSGCDVIEDKEIRCLTFQDAGLMTGNRGVVVRIGEEEFQLTIVQSR